MLLPDHQLHIRQATNNTEPQQDGHNGGSGGTQTIIIIVGTAAS